mgnify:FL=1
MIYFDNAATTFLKKEVLDEMMPYLTEEYGNPSSIYRHGQKAQMALIRARETVAKALNADPREIYFTGSGSEADNWAIKGAAFRNRKKGNHIITSSIEHHAVLHTCEYLEKQGFQVTYLPVDEYGLVSVEDVKKAITDETILITIMFANNEIGTIQPIKEIAQMAGEKGILFHTDAVQAVGALPIDVKDLGVDMLSLSAHKFNGPKGVGALYIRKGVVIDNLIHGGGQERGKRASTENVAGIVGLAKAIELATSNIEEKSKKITALRDKVIKGVLERVPDCRLNGHPTMRLPNNANFSFKYIEGEGLLLLLDANGICASSGSACTSGSLDPSHVLLAIGLDHETAHGSLRISLSEFNTEEEVDKFLEVLPAVVQRLRDMSPLYDKR